MKKKNCDFLNFNHITNTAPPFNTSKNKVAAYLFLLATQIILYLSLKFIVACCTFK